MSLRVTNQPGDRVPGLNSPPPKPPPVDLDAPITIVAMIAITATVPASSLIEPPRCRFLHRNPTSASAIASSGIVDFKIASPTSAAALSTSPPALSSGQKREAFSVNPAALAQKKLPTDSSCSVYMLRCTFCGTSSHSAPPSRECRWVEASSQRMAGRTEEFPVNDSCSHIDCRPTPLLPSSGRACAEVAPAASSPNDSTRLAISRTMAWTGRGRLVQRVFAEEVKTRTSHRRRCRCGARGREAAASAGPRHRRGSRRTRRRR